MEPTKDPPPGLPSEPVWALAWRADQLLVELQTLADVANRIL